MPGRILSVNSAALSLIAVCILAAAILVAVTSSEHPAVVRAAAVTPAAAPTVQPAATPKPREIEPEPAASGTAATNQAAPQATPVTITGCLQRDGQSFRLTDTEGTQAPKSRSWKSGFLKKGNSAVAVVDSGKKLNLSRHVNERVNVTGVVSGHSMQARALTRAAKSCS